MLVWCNFTQGHQKTTLPQLEWTSCSLSHTMSILVCNLISYITCNLWNAALAPQVATPWPDRVDGGRRILASDTYHDPVVRRFSWNLLCLRASRCKFDTKKIQSGGCTDTGKNASTGKRSCWKTSLARWPWNRKSTSWMRTCQSVPFHVI